MPFPKTWGWRHAVFQSPKGNLHPCSTSPHRSRSGQPTSIAPQIARADRLGGIGSLVRYRLRIRLISFPYFYIRRLGRARITNSVASVPFGVCSSPKGSSHIASAVVCDVGWFEIMICFNILHRRISLNSNLASKPSMCHLLPVSCIFLLTHQSREKSRIASNCGRLYYRSPPYSCHLEIPLTHCHILEGTRRNWWIVISPGSCLGPGFLCVHLPYFFQFASTISKGSMPDGWSACVG